MFNQYDQAWREEMEELILALSDEAIEMIYVADAFGGPMIELVDEKLDWCVPLMWLNTHQPSKSTRQPRQWSTKKPFDQAPRPFDQERD